MIGFVIAGYRSHFFASLKLARDLRSRGYDVVYFGSDRLKELAEEQRFRFEPAAFIRSMALEEEGVRGLAALRHARRRGRELLASPPEIDREAAALVRRHRPSLLIFDLFLLIFSIPFQRYGVRVAAMNSMLLLDFDPQVPPWTSPLVPSPNLLGRAQVGLAWLRCHASYAMYRAKTARTRVMTGYSPRRFADEMAAIADYPLATEWDMRPVWYDFRLRSVPELVLSAPELDFPRERGVRKTVTFLGPCVDFDRREAPLRPESIPRAEHLVYCSLGSVAQARDAADVDFLRRVLAAFRGDRRFALLLVTSSAEISAALGAAPSNVRIVESAPQLAVLARASVMLTPGGSNSVKECIQSRVPLVAYPRHSEQPGASARVVYHGLGLRGDPLRDGPERIRASVHTLVTCRATRDRIARMAAIFDQYDVDAVHVRRVEALLENRLRLAPTRAEARP